MNLILYYSVEFPFVFLSCVLSLLNAYSRKPGTCHTQHANTDAYKCIYTHMYVHLKYINGHIYNLYIIILEREKNLGYI